MHPPTVNPVHRLRSHAHEHRRQPEPHRRAHAAGCARPRPPGRAGPRHPRRRGGDPGRPRPRRPVPGRRFRARPHQRPSPGGARRLLAERPVVDQRAAQPWRAGGVVPDPGAGHRDHRGRRSVDRADRPEPSRHRRGDPHRVRAGAAGRPLRRGARRHPLRQRLLGEGHQARRRVRDALHRSRRPRRRPGQKILRDGGAARPSRADRRGRRRGPALVRHRRPRRAGAHRDRRLVELRPARHRQRHRDHRRRAGREEPPGAGLARLHRPAGRRRDLPDHPGGDRCGDRARRPRRHHRLRAREGAALDRQRPGAGLRRSLHDPRHRRPDDPPARGGSPARPGRPRHRRGGRRPDARERGGGPTCGGRIEGADHRGRARRSNTLFELSGTRSTLAEHNLDRHWRNARTHTLHDPVRWKVAIVGNHALNGVNPPFHAWS